jgi:formiminotetrahydrofolate cyclodeaminase
MTALAGRSLEDLLEDVAARRPAPGGGCASAWTCALGAGLVEMAAAFGLARPDQARRADRLRQVHARAGELRATAVVLGERDLESYGPVLEALRLPAEDPGRSERLRAALSAAVEAPLAVAEAAAEVAELAAEARSGGSRHLEGDAAAGALLAEAACRAAGRLVELNLADRPDDGRLARVDGLARRAARAREEVLR